MVHACATTAIGLEPVLRDELQAHGARPRGDELDFRGWQAFSVESLERLGRLVGSLRTAHRVGVVLARGRVDDEDPWPAFSDLVDGIDLGPWADEGTTFAVRCRRRGDQAFGSLDVERRVGGLLDDRLAGSVDLEDPDLLVRVQVDPACRVAAWADLVGPASLHKRRYRVQPHPAAMKGNIACGLLHLLDLGPGDRLVDPMCGGGTVGIEAAWMLHDAPVTRLRSDEITLRRLPAFRDLDLGPEDVAQAPAGGAGCDHPPIRMGDAHEPHVAKAKGNVKAARAVDCIQITSWDARNLADRVDAADVVATNPPYGVRTGSPARLGELYGDVLGEIARVLAPGGRVGLMTPRTEAVQAAADEHGLEVRRSLGVHHGNVPIRLFVLG